MNELLYTCEKIGEQRINVSRKICDHNKKLFLGNRAQRETMNIKHWFQCKWKNPYLEKTSFRVLCPEKTIAVLFLSIRFIAKGECFYVEGKNFK